MTFEPVYLESIRRKRASLNNELIHINNDMDSLIEESERVTLVAHNADQIIKDLDAEFEKRTNLNQKDISFMFFATGLLCVKWIIMQATMPLSFDFSYNPIQSSERLNSTEMGAIDTKGKSLEEYKKTLETVKKNHANKTIELQTCVDESTREKIQKSIKNNEKRQTELNKVIDFLSENNDIREEIEKNQYKREKLIENADDKPSKYRTVKDIFLLPVPYDAMNPIFPACDLPVNLSGVNHHAYTLGHDPILGWVIGSMNIMSGSITLNYPNYPVYWVESNKIKCRTRWISFIMSCFNSAKEDASRISAAVIRQALHFASDKYGKTGLSFSLATNSPEQAQELIQKGWNSEEVKKAITKVLDVIKKDASIIAVQYMISFIINQIVYSIYMLMYDETSGIPFELYKAKANRILSLANTISTTSNYVYVVIMKQLSALDIGGSIETIRLIINDDKYRKKIKHEFIQNSFIDLIGNKDCEFNYLIDMRY